MSQLDIVDIVNEYILIAIKEKNLQSLVDHITINFGDKKSHVYYALEQCVGNQWFDGIDKIVDQLLTFTTRDSVLLTFHRLTQNDSIIKHVVKYINKLSSKSSTSFDQDVKRFL